jgi:hypothetical protein
MKEFVNNKVVDIQALKAALQEEFKDIDFKNFSETSELSDVVDIFIQDTVEIPAAEQADVIKFEADIYETIDNVNELRDLQNDFVKELEERFEAYKNG